MDKTWEGNYARGYIDGFLAATEEYKANEEKPYLEVEDIMKRYDVGINKARSIIIAVRHFCNGGKLDSSSRVLLSEIKYWENAVDTRYKERL